MLTQDDNLLLTQTGPGSKELLGSTERGIVLWRNLLRQQIKLVQEGKEPDGVIRDPRINETIGLQIEKHRQARFERELAAAK